MGDVLRLRKRHPCGGYEWEIVRLGADIGLRCCTCRRRARVYGDSSFLMKKSWREAETVSPIRSSLDRERPFCSDRFGPASWIFLGTRSIPPR
ncbi:MAG: DUF951 domain-containing protein, partial [Bacteroidetes bacterium]|nr:DUF951 domain-containing protein [Bacteroidota bacterium]